jgi:hypothetical protein
MNSPRENLPDGNLGAGELLRERKALLLARSSLYRLELAREADLLRQSLEWRNLASSAKSAGMIRPLIVGALILVTGRSRLAKILALATRVLAVVKMVQGVREIARRRKAP